MGHFQSGAELDVDDHDSWRAMQPIAGLGLEVHLGTSSLGAEDEDWAAFYIVSVANRLDGTLVLSCRILGATNPELVANLESFCTDGVLRIHLCISRPCVDVEPMMALHATRIRLWNIDEMKEAEYIPKGKWTEVKKWRKAAEGGSAGPRKKPAARTSTRKAPAGKESPAGPMESP